MFTAVELTVEDKEIGTSLSDGNSQTFVSIIRCYNCLPSGEWKILIGLVNIM